MNRNRILLFCALLCQIVIVCTDRSSITSPPEEIDSLRFTSGLVSTGWLSSNLTHRDLIIVDVRSAAEFANGRIPNSINIPFDVPVSVWIEIKGGLLLEVPELSELADTLGKHGIASSSRVVLITSVPTQENPYSLAAPTRVALTLAYAGLSDIAILDGGFNKWAEEGKPVSTSAKVITPVTFTVKESKSLFVDMNYVNENLQKIPLVDARDAAVYAGEEIEDWANKPGHIPGAQSLPAPLFWNADGTYKTKAEIETLVKGVIGDDRNKEVVVYCGVGGYASTVWFVLTQILDYNQIKVYDGAAQEWVLYHDMVTTTAQ